MANIEKELDLLRQNLLDLSLRNNLVNYRVSKSQTLSIIDEHPREIYNIFVLQEKSMKFLPAINQDSNTLKTDFEAVDNADIKWAPIINEDEEPENYFDNYLNTPYEPEELEKRLFYIANKANSVFEEQGYPVLYLALGFLNWTESKDSNIVHKAPLILVPVELKRPGVGRKFTLQWTGDDIFTSITLQAKLAEQGVELPEFEMPDEKTGIDTYFQSVVNAISEKKDWKVLSEISLDFFNFKKFVMYKDLDPVAWPGNLSPANHPLMEQIFNPKSDPRNLQSFSENDVDIKLSAKNTYHIMDADSSQIAVIEDVKAGKNLVVEGPPGTGKSQTIANTIAELLVQGKSVLFVSEKMAALQVVKTRIDNTGLGDLCLEIHSNKAKKKEVLSELERTLNKPPIKQVNIDQEINKLEQLKSELNEYARALHEPIGKRGISLYNLYGLREEVRLYFTKVNRSMLRVEFSDPDKWDNNQWDKAISTLEKLTELLPSINTVSSNPWRGCEPDDLLPPDIEELNKLIDETLQSVSDLESLVKKVVNLTGTDTPLSESQLIPLIDAAKIIVSMPQIDEEVLKNPEWNSPNKDAEELILELRKYQELDSIVKDKFKISILEIDVSSFKSLSSKFLKFLSSKYKKTKREIQSYYNSKPPSDDIKILEDLRYVSDLKLTLENFESLQSRGKKFFGIYWNNEKTDPKSLEDLSKMIVSFKRCVLEGKLSENACKLISKGSNKEDLSLDIKNIQQINTKLVDQQNSLFRLIKPDFETIFGRSFDDVTFEETKNKLNLWKYEQSSLITWSHFINHRNKCLHTVAAPLIHLIDNDKIIAEDLVYAFKGNYVDSLLRIIFREKKFLPEFVKELQDNKISKFKELDKRVIFLNRQRIAYEAYCHRPNLSSGASKDSEAGILLKEFTRKRGHLPIRKLMTKAGGLIQKIKPCFMMSPLSVAQYLDPSTTKFDVIVFDEASQVKPEDAIGALLRGNQAVVMGDSRQLPPTSFFDHVADALDFDPDDDSDYKDMESILNMCKRSFPSKSLLWHYRSRHDSLIAVSNREFYNNRLYVYPSPMHDSENLGLKFVHLPDTIYDRGKSSVNLGEAHAVAKAVLEQYNLYPSKSIGVGTFNTKQQQAILNEIDLLIHQDPAIYFKNEKSEKFFVKNIETIQGDERDIIFISVGFGFDSYHKLSRSFGALNQEGGERRLNVLISRAREKCIVFSNFTAKDLSIDGSASVGLKALKTFLEYAETKNFNPISGPGEDSDSPFEDSVYEFLRDNGYEVHKQVGCAAYRIDLAIVDQRNRGRYLIGIECDGAQYHSSPVARDRDRLRQQRLEELGWKIYRVWSTDWYRHPVESGKKLLEAIESTKLSKMTEGISPKNNSETYQDKIRNDEKTNVINCFTSQNETLEKPQNEIPKYKICPLTDISTKDFSELYEFQLEEIITKIVKIEGPIHSDELIQRVKMHFGIARAGNVIKSTIQSAIKSAEKSKKILIKDHFLWPDSEPDCLLRKRCGDTSVKIEWICDEEIAQAVFFVLNNQYSTAQEDLTSQAARVLGIKVVRKNAKDKINNIIESLIQDNHLTKLPNNMLYFKETVTAKQIIQH
ncbi:DUF3320 domain-containing protein [Methanosarcina sp. MSH10X1]|uniref:DUF3320 domain-containing protein n=1 Tax=Methanosarcina sp. MSH10X1 TaxID=2507075 RepID=UPI000FFC0C02|nr:DUF3320 domain-containing protein [Methanosarcina sp. MSH10X1]RXA17256.1 DUF3320 domain-containing protein [Methanosarcina sp. MSH10X1]